MTMPAGDGSEIRLEGTPNFRDLGGLPGADGRAVRHGLLYRSEGPLHLTARDIDLLQARRFRLVCDLRSEGERLAAPNAWCGEPAALFNADASVDLRAAGNDAWAVLRDDPSATGARRAMLINYQAMPRVMAPHLRTLIERMVDQHDLPALIHCTAGKDRTGFVVAMLLSALGVPRAAIEADYLASSQFIDERFAGPIVEAFEASFGFAPAADTIRAMIAIERSYLEAAFASVAAVAGSVDVYLEAQLGLDRQRMMQLRDVLLD